VVGPEAFLALFAVNEGVAEPRKVPRSLPDLWVHEDRGVDPHNIAPIRDHRPPPSVLDVALEFHPQRPVVPATVKPAVDFAGLKNKASAFGKAYDGGHQVAFIVLILSHNNTVRSSVFVFCCGDDVRRGLSVVSVRPAEEL